MSKQNMCSGHKNETKTTTQQKSKHKKFAKTGIRTWDLSHHSQMLYLRTTEISECNYCSQATCVFICFNVISRNINKQSQISGPCTHFQHNRVFFLHFLNAWIIIFGFLYLQE